MGTIQGEPFNLYGEEFVHQYPFDSLLKLASVSSRSYFELSLGGLAACAKDCTLAKVCRKSVISQRGMRTRGMRTMRLLMTIMFTIRTFCPSGSEPEIPLFVAQCWQNLYGLDEQHNVQGRIACGSRVHVSEGEDSIQLWHEATFVVQVGIIQATRSCGR
eukprot:16416-Amphidinium_carterae.7